MVQRDRGERTGQSGELEEKNNLKEKARQKIRDLEEKKKTETDMYTLKMSATTSITTTKR